MGFPKECIFCGADKNELIGWIENDYLQKWECKKCGKRWDRKFELNVKGYYEMSVNVHIIINGNEKEQHNFWRGESYTEQEFEESGLSLELLLLKEWCKRNDFK